MDRLAPVRNASALPYAAVPELSLADFHEAIATAIAQELRVCALLATPRDDGTRLLVVLGDDARSRLLLGSAEVPARRVLPALTQRCPQAHLFERELHEQHGLDFAGHPGLAAVRAPRGDNFYRIAGEAIHEVAVGPVHAGVIEPGHFRFQCHGEHVFHLEIALGYQHRGVEEALQGGPHKSSLHQIETAAGDTTIGHTLAYCENLEALAGARVSGHAHVVRAIALELERLANHVGDLGALAGDVGFLPTASFCGRLRGDFLNMTALLCGNRFGRSLLRPGGVRFPIDAPVGSELQERLAAVERDVTRAIELLWMTPSVVARFENTGAVSAEASALLGLVGPAARACGAEIDVRKDHPTGAYCYVQLPVATAQTGDVHARAFVRWLEVQRSMRYVAELLTMLPPALALPRKLELAPDHVAVSLVEGWRGEICHVAVTDAQGRFARYKVVDPSFHNWAGLALAMRGQEISDFPLCNKSFNLSYCGHDL